MSESEAAEAVSTGEQQKNPHFKKRYRLLASGLFLWWIFTLISGDIFPFEGYAPLCSVITRICILVGCIAVLVVFAKWRDYLKPWVMRTAALAATVASFVLGTGQMSMLPPVLLYVASFIAGGCAACFLLGWGTLYAKYHLESITVIALLSVAIGSALLWAETLIPAGNFRALPMLLAPLVHLAFFYEFDAEAISVTKLKGIHPRFNAICMFTPPIHSTLYGILAGIGLASTAHVFNPISGMYAFFLVLYFLVFAGLAAFTLRSLQFSIIHRPVLVLLIPMIIMATFVFAKDQWNPGFWMLCAIILFLTNLWVATCDIADILNLDIIWFFAVRFSAALAALGAGFAVGTGIVAAFTADSPIILVVVIAVLAFQVVSSITTMEDQEAMNKTAEQAAIVVEAEVSTADVCASLGEKTGLSAREIEVLELLAQGRDPSRIQEQLFLSYHTVRNHIKSIYRKLDVHSRQELIDVLEHEMDTLKQTSAQQAKPAKKSDNRKATKSEKA